MRRGGCLALVFLTVAVAVWMFRPHPDEALAAALRMGRLAPLPASATDVHVATHGNLFSRQFYVRFRADPSEITEFVARSPGLQNAKPSKRLRSHVADLAWFRPENIPGSRHWEIPADANANYGEVVVDGAQNTIYLYVSHS